MNDDNLYPLATFVTIQGPRVLRLLEFQNEFALFDVIGFENQIFVQDFRQNSIRAVYELEEKDDPSFFADEFNAPAHLTVETQPDQSLLIKLEDTPSKKPEYMLWIAIGFEDDIPLYNYLFEHILPFDNDTFAIVAVYQRPANAYQFEDESDLASPSSFSPPSRYKSSSERSDFRISSGMY
ncbi:MAG: hypothetical protein IPM53_25330 [Anaerolineaceae bacterium]|nr:hypothetical protein [Anaerolineaceae bacterium]